MVDTSLSFPSGLQSILHVHVYMYNYGDLYHVHNTLLGLLLVLVL